MAFYKIEWKSSSIKELKRLPKTIIARVISEVDQLAKNPYPYGYRKLTGTGSVYRIRIGEYRVIYQVSEEKLIIQIVRVGHRKGVYR